MKDFENILVIGFVPRQTDGADLQCGRHALAISLSLFMQHDADELIGKNGAIKAQEISELELGIVASQYSSADGNFVLAAAMILDNNFDDTSPVV
ncbi:hypothetical protein BPAE_0157g00150 [Botrytis paeoniae]|uniref:Uncharacterized protein n=1 Tax=Botrytis paeoniae TaxID=278948 RepID=A0A4Z1FHI0_9HELO|nr:hypothetical protein BPAE_0157g00150 [Botrytis paeoniae]